MSKNPQRAEYMRKWRAEHPEYKEKTKQWTRNWRQRNPEKVKAADRKYGYRRHLKKTYGLTLADFESLWAKQSGHCAICKEPLIRGNKTHVDHSHKTGKVRGLLCAGCNVGLARVEDTEFVARCLAYLGVQ